MTDRDAFEDLARYYDPLMSGVDYDHWHVATSVLAELVPAREFTHLDVACGTGVLLKRLSINGWNCVGIDLSPSMLREGKKGPHAPRTALADMRALPFSGCFDYATCLFDSLNFLLERNDVARTFKEFYDVLGPQGVLYFDVITERMVTDHFEGQNWRETTGGFSSSWDGTYDRPSGVASTTIRIKSGPTTIVLERIYPVEDIESMLASAGFCVLGVFDAETWKSPNKKTLRVDIVAVKENSWRLRRQFQGLKRRLAGMLA